MLTFRAIKKLTQQVFKHRFFHISYNAVAISGNRSRFSKISKH